MPTIRRPGNFDDRKFNIDDIDDFSTETIPTHEDEEPIFINLKKNTSPCLLLPLRLEYRVIQKSDHIRTVDDKTFRDELEKIKKDNISDLGEYKIKRRAFLKKTKQKKYNIKNTSNNQEIWFRWYPDESFSENGIAPASEEEKELLIEFNKAIEGEKWWNIEVEKVEKAWQHFASHVGGERSVHLLRTDQIQEENSTAWESRIGRISVLPKRVALFSLKHKEGGDDINLLIEGNDIPQNSNGQRSEVSYTHDALEEGSWLANFNTAIKLGMGVKIQDKYKINQALDADWIIAVGLHSGSTSDEIETLFQDKIANGEFEFLSQDSPTNNNVDDTSALKSSKHDLKAFLKKATCYEQEKIPTGNTSSSLMQNALGLSKPIFDQAINADNLDLEDARAMFRVIGPALLDDSVDGITPLEGIDENLFVETLLSSLSARGILSPFRSGRNAYGIVTITDIDKYKPHDSLDGNGNIAKIHNFVRDNCKIARAALPKSAAALVPIIKPEDDDAANNLEEILKTHRTSVRIDVETNNEGNTAPIACPYVENIDSKEKYKASKYLNDLRQKDISSLVDPTGNNTDWPLLYRLARQTLNHNIHLKVVKSIHPSRNFRSLRSLSKINSSKKLKHTLKDIAGLSINDILAKNNLTITGVPSGSLVEIRAATKKFSDALAHLESINKNTNGRAKLEILLLETIDLFQHRIDAWATGLAYERLRLDRLEEKNTLRAGYYGFISKLRHETRNQQNEYIQTPSLAQATSAAIMRSAYLRHKNQDSNAFEINLRSKRARHALSLLELLKKGLSLGEALGMQGERWLQDNKKSKSIFKLRTDFPIKNTANASQGQDATSDIRRVFDGLIFINAPDNKIPNNLRGLRTKLEESLDALSDLVVAEAIHHRAMGAGDVANAWIQVLSGSPVPGEPIFLKTQRQGQASSHRVILGLIPQKVKHTGDERGSPRSIAEPAISRLAEQLLTEYDNAKITLTLLDKDSETILLERDFYLKKDLYMHEVDLVIGGKSELYSRIKHLITFQLINNPNPNSMAKLSTLLDNKTAIKIGLGKSTQDLLKQASLLQKNIQSARPLEPSDLNAAALPENKLVESKEIELVKGSIEELKSRVQEMQWRLNQVIARLKIGRIKFVKLVKPILSNISPDAILDAIEKNKEALDEQRRITATALWKASYWSEPSALQTFSIYDAVKDIDSLEERLLNVENQLMEKDKILRKTLSINSNLQTLSEAKAAQNLFISAIKEVLDGDALVVLPSYSSNKYKKVITPVFKLPQSSSTVSENKSPSIESANTFQYWKKLREKIKSVDSLSEQLEMYSEHQVDKKVTKDDEEKDVTDNKEQVSPRDKHHGIFLIEPEWIDQGDKSGLVIDEWVSKRPSETQTTGLAVNYDTPQAESPNALLLCVPPESTINAGGIKFSESQAASMVKESIAWMKIRAMSTSDNTLTSLLPNANQVSYKKTVNKDSPRIPKQKLWFSANDDILDWLKEGVFKIKPSEPGQDLSKNTLNERIGFFSLKE